MWLFPHSQLQKDDGSDGGGVGEARKLRQSECSRGWSKSHLPDCTQRRPWDQHCEEQPKRELLKSPGYPRLCCSTFKCDSSAEWLGKLKRKWPCKLKSGRRDTALALCGTIQCHHRVIMIVFPASLSGWRCSSLTLTCTLDDGQKAQRTQPREVPFLLTL